jgi:glycosyltransferase involved in cell wall biosynthesis
VSAELGGSERVLVDLVRELHRHDERWDPIVLVPRAGTLADAVRDAGGDISVVPMPEALAAFGELAWDGRTLGRCVRAWGAARAVGNYARLLGARLLEIAPDVVHSNGLKFHVLAARAGTQAPLVWHMHEYLSDRRLSQFVLRQHVSRASLIVANSRSVAADVRAALDPPVPIETVYNGIDLLEFAPAGPAADLDALAGLDPSPPGTVRIGLVATYGRWKGHDLFLAALAGLNGPWRAYIVGGPLYDTQGSQYSRHELQSMIARLGLVGRVGLTGWVDRPSAALRALDVVVHASTRPEPFGLVIAQAMGCARATIISAAGGAAELVTDGRDGLTHHPGNEGGLRSAMQRCVDDDALRRSLAEQARSSAEARFDVESLARQFAGIYTRLARRPAIAS